MRKIVKQKFVQNNEMFSLQQLDQYKKELSALLNKELFEKSKYKVFECGKFSIRRL
jgi:hypothetical protein